MKYDFCLDCGVLLPPHQYDCPVCGFENSFDGYQDIPIDDAFFNDSSNDFNPDENTW